VVVMAVVGGFVMLSWYAYHAGIRSVKEEDLLVIEADKAPLKEKPADPGGMHFPNQDKTVYNTFADTSRQTAKVERVLPVPEEPMSKERQKEAAEARAETEAGGPATWVNRDLQKNTGKDTAKDAKKALDKSKIAATVAGPDEKTVYTIKDANEHQVIAAQSGGEEDQSVSFVAPRKGAAPAAAVEKAIQGPEKKAKPFDPEKIADKPVEKADDTGKSALKPMRENVFAKEEPADEAPEPGAQAKLPGKTQEKPAAGPAEETLVEKGPVEKGQEQEKAKEASRPQERKTAAGGAVVQLGAYRSEEEAQETWDKMHLKFKELSDKKPTIIRADLGARGVYYRLRIGSLASVADAKELCKALAGRGQACIIPVGN
jgi:hypothetical protein